MKQTFVHSNGLRHRVLAFGEHEHTLLILPGITSPAATVGFLAEWLAERYTVHVPDLRGRGDSDTPGPGNYTLEHYAADVAGLVETLELRRPVLLGHSLGARIAAAYRVRHDRGRCPLILVDPPLSGPGRDPYPTDRASFAAQLSEARAGTTAEQVRRYYPNWPRRELELRAKVLSTCDETAVLETHANFHTEDFFTYWRTIDRPAAVIRGAESPVVTTEGARELAETNPAIPIETVPSAGHMVPWDNLQGFRAAIDNALGAFD